MTPAAVFFFVIVLGLLAFMDDVERNGYRFTREPLRPEAPKPRQRRRTPAVTVYSDATLIGPRRRRRRKGDL